MSNQLTPQQEGRAHGQVLMQAIAKPFYIYQDAYSNLIFEHAYWQQVTEAAWAESIRVARLLEQTHHTRKPK